MHYGFMLVHTAQVQHQKASIANANKRRLRAENLAIVEAGDEII